MLLLTLDETSRKPQYQQILEQIRHKIETRTLLAGEKLPSTRQLADKLGIHRSTVAVAYQELWALGFVDLRPGSCPRVRERAPIATADDRSKEGLIDWNTLVAPGINALTQNYQKQLSFARMPDNPSLLNFSTLGVDPRLFPLDSFRSCLNQTVKEKGAQLLSYGDPEGYYPLRQYIAHRLQSHGISASTEEILITNGSQHGLDLVLRLLVSPQRSIVVESPTYNQMGPLLRFLQITPLEVPLRHDGMDLDILEQVFQQHNPALVYTMPSFQNPTGICTSQAHREKLLALCEAHRVPILEDAFEEEMKYFGRVVLPIKSIDRQNLVIYCGTFSKVLFPGARIGWLAADKECIRRLAAIRYTSEISPDMILQAAIHSFCQNGYYDRHISKMHRYFRKRMQTALKSLQQYISPAWAEWSQPSGGFVIWLQLKPLSNPPSDWRQYLASHGIQVAPGSWFFLSETKDTHLRLSIAALDEEEIVEGIRRLASALSAVYLPNKR